MFKQQKEQESFKLLLLFCNLLHGEGGMRCALGLCRQPRAVPGKTNLLPTSQSPKPIAALGLLRRTLFSGSIPLILRNKKASRMRGLFVWRRRRDTLRSLAFSRRWSAPLRKCCVARDFGVRLPLQSAPATNPGSHKPSSLCRK